MVWLISSYVIWAVSTLEALYLFGIVEIIKAGKSQGTLGMSFVVSPWVGYVIYMLRYSLPEYIHEYSRGKHKEQILGFFGYVFATLLTVAFLAFAPWWKWSITTFK
jgi:hypothetical protein